MLSEMFLIHHSHYRQYILRLKVFVGGGNISRLPHFIQIVHSTGRRSLIGHGFLTINNSRMTVLQMLVTKKHPPLNHYSPLVAVG